jgi:hypothetical protein
MPIARTADGRARQRAAMQKFCQDARKHGRAKSPGKHKAPPVSLPALRLPPSRDEAAE